MCIGYPTHTLLLERKIMIQPETLENIILTAAEFRLALDEGVFGGKSSGKFKISHERLAMILGVLTVTPEIIHELKVQCYHKDIVICEIIYGFAVFNLSAADNARVMPQSVVENIKHHMDEFKKAERAALKYALEAVEPSEK